MSMSLWLILVIYQFAYLVYLWYHYSDTIGEEEPCMSTVELHPSISPLEANSSRRLLSRRLLRAIGALMLTSLSGVAGCSSEAESPTTEQTKTQDHHNELDPDAHEGQIGAPIGNPKKEVYVEEGMVKICSPGPDGKSVLLAEVAPSQPKKGQESVSIVEVPETNSGCEGGSQIADVTESSGDAFDGWVRQYPDHNEKRSRLYKPKTVFCRMAKNIKGAKNYYNDDDLFIVEVDSPNPENMDKGDIVGKAKEATFTVRPKSFQPDPTKKDPCHPNKGRIY